MFVEGGGCLLVANERWREGETWRGDEKAYQGLHVCLPVRLTSQHGESLPDFMVLGIDQQSVAASADRQ